MESESAALLPPLYPVDLSPLLAEPSGGSFTLEPFTVEERLDDELFKAAVQVRIGGTRTPTCDGGAPRHREGEQR
ncbi:hypothetical protein EBU60_02160 [bacterium]|nr:hypothetical protein [bacterium]